MNKVIEQAKDLGIKNVVFFRNTTSTVLYTDSALTTLANPEIVLDAYVKNKALIANTVSGTTTLYKPVSCNVGSTNVTLTIDIAGTATDCIAALGTDTSCAALFAKLIA